MIRVAIDREAARAFATGFGYALLALAAFVVGVGLAYLTPLP